MTCIPLSTLQITILNISIAGLFLSVGIIAGIIIQAVTEKA